MMVMSDVCDLRPQYGAQGRRRPDDPAVAELAGRQHGVVAYEQLRAMGFGRRAVQRRVESGRLHPIHQGVFAVGHRRLTGLGRWMAAVLACGPDSLLSHRSAGTLLGIHPRATAAVDVSRPAYGGKARPGIELHRVRLFVPPDRFVWHGIPVTAPARTLLDLAEVIALRPLRRAFEEARRLKLVDLAAIGACLDRSPGRHGQAPMRALIAEAEEPQLKRSELEWAFDEISRTVGLDRPRFNAVVGGFEVDVAWLDRKVIVELDSYTWHSDPAAFESDRARDGQLQLAGYIVLRITYRRLRDEPEAVVRLIRRALERGTGSYS